MKRFAETKVIEVNRTQLGTFSAATAEENRKKKILLEVEAEKKKLRE